MHRLARTAAPLAALLVLSLSACAKKTEKAPAGSPPPGGAPAESARAESTMASTASTKGAQAAAVPGKTLYTCEMHPDYVTDKPGRCPKCGMELVEKK